MRRARLAILAVVLAVLLVVPVTHGAAAVQPSPDAHQAVADGVRTATLFVEEQENTTNYLGIDDDDVERDDYATVGIDVGTAVAADTERLEQGYGALTFEERYRNVSAAERRGLLRSETERIEAETDALDRRHSAAVEAYNDGAITTRQFVARLATIDAAVRELDKRRVLVEEAAREFDSSDAVRTRLANTESKLVSLSGPVREQIDAATASTVRSQTAYVVTAEDGVMLARTEDGVFQREAYVGSSRVPGGSDRFASGSQPGVVNASDEAVELYPWLHSQILPSIRQLGNTSVYYVSAETRSGLAFDAYLDGTTGDVFREIQTKPVDTIPTYTIANRTGDLRIRSNHTHGTGPMTVIVTDPDTGEPKNATVTVNGHTIGSTGEDGRLTTITPYNAVRIRATTADSETILLPFFSR